MARKILLADDSVTAQNMGRKILADAGYEVITVNNGSAALKKIAEQKPDLIVLDVYMPGYSGLEVCQRLKESQETSRLPVLLTVGKLEPFKPEEAKRVRADAFIVKPFEASELLSALSKLEDKIVPRAESSKPGRLARAVASLDEGRHDKAVDKTVALDEDSGWKNRIAFPSKKKENAVQEDGDDSAIYNPINKDLRTVVENKPAERPVETKSEEARVDLAALAPEGLPKDVTAEEIAALAAAAAQVKGRILENQGSDTKQAAPALVEARSEHIEASSAITQEIAAAPPFATFADQKSEEKSENKVEASTEKSSEAPKDATGPSSADVMAAIAGLESDAASSGGTSSGNGSFAHNLGSQSAGSHETGPHSDEPVTMALAAAAGSAAASRWTAVSVAVASDEAAISLELEMQKAYAAFAAAETGHAGFATASAEIQSEPAAEISSQVQAATPEQVVAVPATPAPEAVQTLTEVASAATDAISAAVIELEAVAASYVAQNTPVAASDARVEESSSAITRVAVPEIAHEQPKPESAEGSNGSGSEAAQAATVSPSGTPNHDSDMNASTVAAWASWRQSREAGESKSATGPSKENQDAAAMAVAAGAENHPEDASEASESDPEAIASIVDSVLADLRPRIFEEISRKMGKKK